jgi:hypothetical protein
VVGRGQRHCPAFHPLSPTYYRLPPRRGVILSGSKARALTQLGCIKFEICHKCALSAACCPFTPRSSGRNILRIFSPERKLWYQILPSAQAGVDVRVHSVTGRHRPQRCRQTDKGRGGGGVCPSGRLREVAKDRCSRVTAVLSTPRPLGRQLS